MNPDVILPFTVLRRIDFSGPLCPSGIARRSAIYVYGPKTGANARKIAKQRLQEDCRIAC